jgi:hypothetical protein
MGTVADDGTANPHFSLDRGGGQEDPAIAMEGIDQHFIQKVLGIPGDPEGTDAQGQ